MAWFKQLWKSAQTPAAEANDGAQTPCAAASRTPLAATAAAALTQIKRVFATDDLMTVLFDEQGAALLFLNSLVDSTRLQDDIVPRLPAWLEEPVGTWKLYYPQAELLDAIEDVVDRILSGSVILLRNDLPGQAVVSPKRVNRDRSVEAPQLEKVLLGPQDAFVEDFDHNTSLIRKRIKDPNLIFRYTYVGRRSRSKVAVVYIQDIAKLEWVEEIQTNLNKINIDCVSTHKELMELIVGRNYSVFPAYELTELPMRTAINLTRGRIGIILDGSPFVAFLPTTLFSSFIGTEFVYQGTLIPTFVRLLRMLAFAFALYAPAVYLALVSVNTSVMPLEFSISIARDQEGIPYLSFFETIMMMLTMDILNEAMAFVPGNVGSALNVVGSLIIGQAAAQAGLVSRFLIIIAAFSSIGSFIASYQVSYAMRIWKYPMLLAAGLFGFYGIALVTLVILGHLCKKKSLGVPYMAPISPLKWRDVRSFLFEPDMSQQNEREDTFEPQNKIRQTGDPDT